MKFGRIIFLFILLVIYDFTLSQAQELDINNLTREEILNIPYDDLIELPLDQLLLLADKIGVSLEELYEMILNKDVVSASKKVESSFDAPLSTSVISYEEIVRSGATTIEEALRLAPGFIVRQKTNGNYDVHIRGNDNVPPDNFLLYSENSLSLVMIDGRVVYNYANGGTFWEYLPIDINDIDRIEIVRGPSSALYGPNAVSGVVHIITKKPENKKFEFNANGQAGTQNTKLANASISGGLNKLSYRLSGNYKYFGRFQNSVYEWKNNRYVPVSQLEIDTVPGTTDVYEPNDISKRFPNPDLGRENYGLNAFLFYDVNENISFDLTGGIQYSNILTSPVDNPYYALTRRETSSDYFNFRTKLKNFNYQVNYFGGVADVAVMDDAFKFDFYLFSTNAEYEINIADNFTLRPGLSFNKTAYDDSEYRNIELREGFLNGKKELTTFAYSLRADYLAFDKLRLIAALRGDDYNYPKDKYFTYQFITSYKINDNHIIRVLYSKANRSPFVINTYSNYSWAKVSPNPPVLNKTGYYNFYGTKDLKLKTMNMLEIGYRFKPVKNIQVDIEGFYTETKDFDAYHLDSVNVLMIDNGGPVPTVVPYYTDFSYQNIDVKSIQQGITATISTVINKSLNFKLFGTVQKTHLKDHNPTSVEQGVFYMSTIALSNPANYLSVDTIPGLGVAIHAAGNVNSEEKESFTHKATPAFYGGLIINYSPMDKLSIGSNIYCYTKQTFRNQFETVEIDPKFILNLKVDYKIWKSNSIYFNMRNLLNNKTKEFAFVDDIGGMYLVGLNLNF